MIKKIPLPMAGLILALAALGNLLASYSPAIRWTLGALAGILYVMYVIKMFSSVEKTREDLQNPVVAGVFATFPMATMLLSTYLAPFIGKAAYFLWLFGVGFHAALIVWFTMTFALKKDIKLVFPTWFILYVGIVVASVTGGAFGAIGIARACFWFGFCAYIVLIPIVCYRVFVVKNIPEPALATVIVFTAPGGLLLTGFMNAFEVKPQLLLYFLTIVPCAFYLFALTQLPKVFKLKFYPSISAITFPMVITAIGFKLTNAYLTAQGTPIAGLPILVKGMELIAVVCVFYALYGYFKFLTAKPQS